MQRQRRVSQLHAFAVAAGEAMSSSTRAVEALALCVAATSHASIASSSISKLSLPKYDREHIDRFGLYDRNVTDITERAAEVR